MLNFSKNKCFNTSYYNKLLKIKLLCYLDKLYAIFNFQNKLKNMEAAYPEKCPVYLQIRPVRETFCSFGQIMCSRRIRNCGASKKSPSLESLS